MKNLPRLEIRQSHHFDSWHWSIVMESGHCFALSNSFGSFEEAAMDAALFAGPQMKIALDNAGDIG